MLYRCDGTAQTTGCYRLPTPWDARIPYRRRARAVGLGRLDIPPFLPHYLPAGHSAASRGLIPATFYALPYLPIIVPYLQSRTHAPRAQPSPLPPSYRLPATVLTHAGGATPHPVGGTPTLPSSAGHSNKPATTACCCAVPHLPTYKTYPRKHYRALPPCLGVHHRLLRDYRWRLPPHTLPTQEKDVTLYLVDTSDDWFVRLWFCTGSLPLLPEGRAGAASG